MFGINTKDFYKDVASLNWTKDKKLFDNNSANQKDMLQTVRIVNSQMMFNKGKSIDETNSQTLKLVDKVAKKTGWANAGSYFKKYGLTYVSNTIESLE